MIRTPGFNSSPSGTSVSNRGALIPASRSTEAIRAPLPCPSAQTTTRYFWPTRSPSCLTQPVVVAHTGSQPDGRHHDGAGTLRRRGDRPGRGLGLGQQPVEGQMQAGEVLTAGAPGRSQRRRPAPPPRRAAPAARSRMRRGSTSRIWASAGSRSTRVRSSEVSHGSQDSMPSKTRPSARRSHCWRPQGWAADRGGRLGPARPRSGAARGSRTARRGRARRSSAGRRRRTRSAGPPRRPTGRCARARRQSTGRRRRSSRERRARRGARPGTRGGSPLPVSRATSSVGSSTSPGRTTTGASSSTWGPRRCSRARTGATITRGTRSSRPRSSRWLSRHMARSRRPMVSTPGLTRSKGSVSHAGNISTWSGPRKAARSWASWSASAAVGTATTIG